MLGRIIDLGLPVGEAQTEDVFHRGQGSEGGKQAKEASASRTTLLHFTPPRSTARPHLAPHPFTVTLWVLALAFLPPGILTPPHPHLTQLKYTFFVKPAWTRLQTECLSLSAWAPTVYGFLFKTELGAQYDYSFVHSFFLSTFIY